MAKRTPEQVYRLLIGQGWPQQAAVYMTAIAGAESGYRNDALGDVDLESATWGPSYGLFQIRTLKGDTGHGTNRDISRLSRSDVEQAKAAWEISRHGTDFTPWTVYRTGKYESFLSGAQAAAGVAQPIAIGTDGPFPSWIPGLNEAAAGARNLGLQLLFVVAGVAVVGVGLGQVFKPQIQAGLDWVGEKRREVAKVAAVAAK